MSMKLDEERKVSLSAFEAGAVVTLIEDYADRVLYEYMGEAIYTQLVNAASKIDTVFGAEEDPNSD